jgi:hypothetical protein
MASLAQSKSNESCHAREPPSHARSADKKKHAAEADQRDTRIVDFVCEEDVRIAIQPGHTIMTEESTIVTPAALDLGNARRVFSTSGWPR